jgi:hypothetical protein
MEREAAEEEWVQAEQFTSMADSSHWIPARLKRMVRKVAEVVWAVPVVAVVSRATEVAQLSASIPAAVGAEDHEEMAVGLCRLLEEEAAEVAAPLKRA